MKSKRMATIVLAAAALLLVAAGIGRDLTEEDWEKLRQKEIVKQVVKEEGSQSASWSAKIVHYPPELMWKVITSLELYDEHMERTTVSVLLDEKTKDKVVESGQEDADEVEELFEGMESGYVKKRDDGTWTVYSYQRNEFPWPVSDRWVLLEITHDDDMMHQSWKRLAGNIMEDYGYWKLSPHEKDSTLAINEIHIDLDIPATGPFTAFAMEVTLPDTYTGFEKMAKAMKDDK